MVKLNFYKCNNKMWDYIHSESLKAYQMVLLFKGTLEIR